MERYLGVLSFILGCLASFATASEPVQLRHQFEAEQSTWVVNQRLQTRVQLHRRSDVDHHSGNLCEQFSFLPGNTLANQAVYHELPAARVFDELKLTVWVRSNCPGLRLGIQILFPHQSDPRTGRPLMLDLIGDRYTASAEWQMLTCATTDAAMAQRLIRAREELSNGVDVIDLDARDLQVVAAVLVFDVPDQPSGLLVDDLELGPIIDPREAVAGTLPERPTTPAIPPVNLHVGDRITRDDRPFFPLFSIHHGEPADRIANLGINMVWVPDYQDQELLQRFSELNLGVIAVPPQPSREQAVTQSAALPTFPDSTTPIWAWMLGAEIPPGELNYIEAWAEQVRNADRQYRRPLMGEVLADHRAFHRTTTLLGSTRLPMQTSLSPEEILRRAQRNRALALPGKATFTFINTEPTSETIDARPAGTPFPALEPEQILTQSFAAIAAGYRGLGFWKQFPLDDSAPGMVEREQAIRLACIETRLLEDFLSSGRVVREVAVQVGDAPIKRGDRLAANNPFSSRWDSVLLASGEVVQPGTRAQSLKAYLLQSDAGFLVLPIRLDDGAQFVPGPQQTQDIRFLLPPGTNAAWEVTTTGINSQIDLTPVAGGVEAHLPNMSVFSVIIATSSRETLDRIRSRTRLLREEAANAWLMLANAKLERTRTVQQQLAEVGAPAIVNGDGRLASATALLDRARSQFDRGDYDRAREDCEQALQYVCAVQRQHWLAAIDTLSSPVASPYTICFQTLPMHWRLMADIGQRSTSSPNLLHSGSFEDRNIFAINGWENHTKQPGNTEAAFDQPRVGLEPGGVVGRTALIFESPYLQPDKSNRTKPLNPAKLVSPSIDVAADDIVLITGQIRIPQPLDAPEEGFLLYDSLYGPSAALRWSPTTSGWQPFRIIRHVRQDSAVQLHLELHARGRVELDDLQVMIIPHADE